MKDRIDDTPFHPATIMVSRNEFTTPAVAFAAYLLGGLLLIINSGMGAFYLLTVALIINILDAYTFPALNALSGRRSGLILGAGVEGNKTGNPEAVFFMKPSKHSADKRKKRTLYRLGFSGGGILFFASMAHLFRVHVHPLVIISGSALAITGFFSYGIYRDEMETEKKKLQKIKKISKKLLSDEGFRSWIIILTGNRSQTRRFLGRYRKYILTSPCFFINFDEGLKENTCTINMSHGVITGYRPNKALITSITRISQKNDLVVINEKDGLDLDCQSALARGYKAASITFNHRVEPTILINSFIEMNRLKWKRGNLK